MTRNIALVIVGLLAAISLAIIGWSDLENLEPAWGVAGMCAGGIVGMLVPTDASSNP